MTDLAACVPEHPEGEVWDVIVVGTGAGGATAGFSLARRGRSVLFVERGRLAPQEEALAATPTAGDVLDSGWWPHRVYEQTSRGDLARPLPMGCAIGGSTALFAGVMDRLRPADLTPGRFAREAPASSLPDAWPIGYADLEPYYRQAETLFRVRGTEDPLAPTGAALLDPPAPSRQETAMHGLLARAGLHLYRLHCAREPVGGCTGCLGRLCRRPCRNDAARICLRPALTDHGARILPECLAIRIETDGRAVRQAICLWRGRRVVLRARIFVLALNAFLTPALLLRSAGGGYPNGVGNSSGLVGRNLMLHVSDTLLVRFDGLMGAVNEQLNHGIGVNDFYVRDGVKLGSVHAHAARVPVPADAGGAAVFHTIVEDFPYADNRVTPQPGSDDEVRWAYRYPDELRQRSALLAWTFADAFGAQSVRLLHPPGALNIAHACGTCRFGDDPRTSVLDRDNRLHDLDNAYVVDASFFPSSGGIQPSLTIAANALRVSEHVAGR